MNTNGTLQGVALPKFIQLCMPKLNAGQRLIIDKDRQESTFKPSGERIPFHMSMLHAERMIQLGGDVKIIGTRPYRKPGQVIIDSGSGKKLSSEVEGEWMTERQLMDRFGVGSGYGHYLHQHKGVRRQKRKGKRYEYLITPQTREWLMESKSTGGSKGYIKKEIIPQAAAETPEEAESEGEWMTCRQICDEYRVSDSYPSYLYSKKLVDRRKRAGKYEYLITAESRSMLVDSPWKERKNRKDRKPEPEPAAHSTGESEASEDPCVDAGSSSDGALTAASQRPVLSISRNGHSESGAMREIVQALKEERGKPKWTPLAQLTSEIENVNTVNIEYDGRLDQVIKTCDNTIEAARLARVTRRRARLMKWINNLIWK